MDAVDVRLIAHLFKAPLASTSDLGRAIGLTRNAARARLDRLAARGVYGGVCGIPNPALFDAQGLVVVFPPLPKLPTFADVLACAPVVGGSVNHNRQLAAICHVSPGAPAAPPSLLELVGTPPERTFLQRPIPLTPPGAALSRLEWRVLAALIADPRAPIATLATRAGTTAPTMRRHLDRMTTRGIVRFEPQVLTNKTGGHVVFEVYVQGPATRRVQDLAPILGDLHVLDRLARPEGALLLASTTTLGEALAAERKLRETPGVEHAELILSTEGTWATAKLAAMCEVRAQRSPA